MWEVGPEPPFMTRFGRKVVDPAPCRKVVFRLHETLTFENHVKAQVLNTGPEDKVLNTGPED